MSWVALVAGLSLVTATQANRMPAAVSLPSPKRLWQQHPAALARGVSVDGDGTILGRGPSGDELIALEAKTGKRRWSAASGARGVQFTTLALAGESVVVVRSDGQMAAYAIATGALLWQRPEACTFEAAVTNVVLVLCREDDGDLRRLRVIDARTGRGGPSFAVHWDHKYALSERALYVFAKESRRLHKHGLVAGEPGWQRSAPAGPASALLVADDVLLWVGRELQAFAGGTGQPLWSRKLPGNYRGPFVDPVVGPGAVFVTANDALLRLTPGTGAVTGRYELPGFLRQRIARGFAVLVAGERVVVSYPNPQMSPHGVLVSWSRPGQGPTILRRPLGGGIDDRLMGDLLLISSDYDRLLEVVSLAALSPPLTGLSEAAALQEVKAERPSRFHFDLIQQLPVLRPYLERRARDPGDAERSSVVWALAGLAGKDPTLLPLYMELLGGKTEGHVKESAARALAAYNEIEVSRLLLRPRPRPTDARARYLEERIRAAAWDQLWRTGRTTSLGLCPVRTRPLRDLGSPARRGVFGTAHPIVLDQFAPDGRWLSVCQAREDTTEDGKIEIHFGHHGDAVGDELRPYLIVDGGSGHPVDEVLAADPRGRFVAAREGACLVLIDVVERIATTLPNADLRDDQPAFGRHRAVSFDSTGQKMIYLRGSEAGGRVVVRRLREREDTELPALPGALVRARFDPEGRNVLVHTSLSGRLPEVVTSLGARSCRGPVRSYSVLGGTGLDDRTTTILPVEGGPPHASPGLVMPYGDLFLVRDASGAILIEQPGGARAPLVGAECDGTVLHADPARKLVVVICASEADEQGWASIKIVGQDGARAVDARVRVGADDGWRQTTGRLVELGGATIDLDDKRVVAPARREASVWEPERATDTSLLQRGDGATLRAARKSESGVLVGPLRWQRPPASVP